MPLWKITLAYDGTPFHGWQIQPNLPTIQGSLAAALHRITGEAVLPQGSGRTDAGVHALGQVASVALRAPIPASNLGRALNHALPADIRILAVDPAPEGFHARHSARSKTYEYRIFPAHRDRICSPMLARYVWACPWRLDFPALEAAAAHIVGSHDFTTFAATDPDQMTRTSVTRPAESDAPNQSIAASEMSSSPAASPNTRTIHHSTWFRQEEHACLYIYRVTGSGFLHHMVRNLVGTFVEAAAGRLRVQDIPHLLAARNRGASGPTAPARGLFLREVHY